MVTEVMYHVTDETNVDSIINDGLRAGPMGKVFLMDDADLAREYGEVTYAAEDPVVLEVEVLEHKLQKDDEEPGEKFAPHAYFVRGDIEPHDIEVIA